MQMIEVLIEWVGSDIDWTSVNLTSHIPSALALDIIKRTEMHMTIDGCIRSNELAIHIRDQPIYGVAVMAVFFLISKYFLDNKVRIAAGIDDISVIGMVNTVGFFLTLITTCFFLPGTNFSALISHIGNLCLSYCYVLAIHRASVDEIWPTMLDEVLHLLGLAARAADVSQLYSALGKDVNALDMICTDNLCDTPLYTAASLDKGE
ncbi:hypothetical protein TorRG33x02_021400 [Trema orientale]|uniref:Uncharacterized protein n=1 Tax=Trema orientale TaxID=63057 RepID=A0A2P5FX30_TREOI|nr:hypothetical protein TorRG33x02_021400 [Trema orientale]